MNKKQAVISVFNKTGIVEFCKQIADKFDFISTGKTATVLCEAGLPVQEVKDVTGFPEILDGRVKTLHPLIMGGVLGREDQEEEMRRLGIAPIRLVVVNLYPFEEIVSKPHSLDDAIEGIDIGGVTLLRGAAKNFMNVIVVSSPDDYS